MMDQSLLFQSRRILFGLARSNNFLLRTSTLTPSYSRFSRRVMSSTTSTPKQQWLVVIPDHEGALASRMAVRPQHLETLTPQVEAGFWQLGGATLASPAEEGKPLQITGSCMLANAESREEVVAALKRDIYFTNGVWNWDKIQIYPFKSAFIKP